MRWSGGDGSGRLNTPIGKTDDSGKPKHICPPSAVRLFLRRESRLVGVFPMSEYSDLLKDPRWQRLRLKIFERDGWRCRDCGRGDRSLNIHHCIYVRGIKPWECDPSLLLTVCEDPCHMDRQNAENEARIAHASVLAITPVAKIQEYTWAELARIHKAKEQQ
jgi:hypothetical protein